MPFQIIRNDITKVKADAIVNTANPDVAVGSGVDHAIYEAAGRGRLLEARAAIGVLEEGEVGITPAFDLDAKYIIHSSGPVWYDGKHGEAEKLRQCYDMSLQLAFDNGCESIAFPLMATGTYSFPKELGLQIAVDSFRDFLEDHEMEITLVVFGSTAYKISADLFDNVNSFIDDYYVNAAITSEYNREIGTGRVERRRERKHPALMTQLPAAEGVQEEKQSLEDILRGIYTDSFGKHLQQLINKKGLKNSEVYSAANITKQYFSKLLKDQVNPSKEKVLALAVGLQLNLDEAVDFLSLAGYSFSPISQTDAVIEFFIRHHDYNVIKIDIVLFDYGLDPLSKS
jgi:O-acetyl-ADP-ribose deacetylase (regulator of RNase III)/transcriptional regulator with XRE-family HTH domain